VSGANESIGGKSAHPNPRRATVMHCPYCASENLWPDTETDNAWECRDCRRVFSVKLHGQLSRDLG
jgi:transposase-like protein